MTPVKAFAAFPHVLRAAFRLFVLASWLLVCLAGSASRWRSGDFGRWPRRFLGGSARIAGVHVRRQGNAASGPVLLLANHVSWIDILALAGVSGTAFVAHDGLRQSTVLRWLCQLNRTVFIARERRGEVAHQAAQLRAALGLVGVLTLFPEGTTSDGRTLRPFKSALLAAIDPPPPGLSVQPVALDYGPDAAGIAWLDNDPGVRNFLRILGRGAPVPLTIRFLPTLSDHERSDRKTMARAAERHIAAALEPRVG